MNDLRSRTDSTRAHKVPRIYFARAAIVCALAAAGALFVTAVDARITRITIDPARSQSPTFGGLSFGSVGQYEKMRGTAFGELDPNDWQNSIITALKLSP